MNTAIIGTGYVGLTLSSLLARTGHRTYCIDVIPEKIDIIKTGKSYFYELGLDNLVKYGIDSGNLIPTLDYEEGLKDADVVFIKFGTNDTGYINDVAELNSFITKCIALDKLIRKSKKLPIWLSCDPRWGRAIESNNTGGNPDISIAGDTEKNVAAAVFTFPDPVGLIIPVVLNKPVPPSTVIELPPSCIFTADAPAPFPAVAFKFEAVA